MRDLRKKVLLESQKTVSRKARSKPEQIRGSPAGSPSTSRAASRANTPPTSRPGSRYASEDEGSDSDFDDTMTMSTNSASGEDGFEDLNDNWKERLQVRVSELQDRKRNAEGREASLVAYTHLLRHHFAQPQIERAFSDLVSALLRSMRGSSTREQILAVKALSLTILTCSSDSVFGHVSSALKTACHDSEEGGVKAEAIYALGLAAMYGGGGVSDAEELLDFLLEVIESDGEYVGAADNAIIVTAALQTWGFVASHLDEELAERVEDALDAFAEQLDSSDPDVQTSAGSNIALLFEVAREHQEETGESFAVQHNKHRILTRMAEIVKDSSKSVSKRGRKHLRNNFSSIVTSLERGLGPGYSTAGRGGNPHVGGGNDAEFIEFGYRDKIRVHNQSAIIDTWLLHARVEILKLVLKGGLPTHFLENPVVKDMLSTAEIEYSGK